MKNIIAYTVITILFIIAVLHGIWALSSVQAYGTRCDAMDVSRSSLALKLNEINGKNPMFMDVEVRAMTTNPVFTISYCW